MDRDDRRRETGSVARLRGGQSRHGRRVLGDERSQRAGRDIRPEIEHLEARLPAHRRPSATPTRAPALPQRRALHARASAAARSAATPGEAAAPDSSGPSRRAHQRPSPPPAPTASRSAPSRPRSHEPGSSSARHPQPAPPRRPPPPSARQRRTTPRDNARRSPRADDHPPAATARSPAQPPGETKPRRRSPTHHNTTVRYDTSSRLHNQPPNTRPTHQAYRWLGASRAVCQASRWNPGVLSAAGEVGLGTGADRSWRHLADATKAPFWAVIFVGIVLGGPSARPTAFCMVRCPHSV
jgi:hypothetical protein